MPVKNIKNLKNDLRAKHRKIRMTCPTDIKRALDQKLTESFLNTDEYKNCSTLFVFVSSPIEVETSDIINSAFVAGKRIAVPRCRDKSGLMDFYYINSVEQLKKGAFSIFEPDPDECELVEDLSQGVCIVPGLCFDMDGYRLGFGGGYYDRFLQLFGGITIGLCYSKCIERELPKGIYDKPVDIIITEKYTNYTHNVFSKE